ncbi:hypothetical protein GCM10023190_15990 [Enteractinococcus fodinae]
MVRSGGELFNSSLIVSAIAPKSSLMRPGKVIKRQAGGLELAQKVSDPFCGLRHTAKGIEMDADVT